MPANEEGENCNDDCAKWKAWAIEDGDPDDELKESEKPDDSDPDTIGTRDFSAGDTIDEPHRLVKRGSPKPAKICGKTRIDGKTQYEPLIEFASYSYPENKAIEKVFITHHRMLRSVANALVVKESVRL
jgi:hypothetical protein